MSAQPAPLDTASRQGLEAVLFLADEPVDAVTLAELIDAEPADVEAALHELADAYLADARGMEIRHVAGGWRMYTAGGAKPVIERWALAGRTGRLTQAALETLAVIAYKQPIGRQEIGDIRGVNADGAVRSLVARGLVAEVGRADAPGQAALFGTTGLFLEKAGLESLDELPPLTDFLPEAPAPDEPELGALKEVRRRLAAGDDAGSLGGRSAAQTNTGGVGLPADEDDEGDDALPPPAARVGEHGEDDEMVDLTDRLEEVARSAVDRLRAVVSAGEDEGAATDGEEPADSDEPAQRPGADHSRGDDG